MPVSSSRKLASVWSAIFSEVITIRHKPSRFEDVLRMYGERDVGMAQR
jgi:hypothetical protein